jgi:hypothetical protein
MNAELVTIVCSCRCGLVSEYGKTARVVPAHVLQILHMDRRGKCNRNCVVKLL